LSYKTLSPDNFPPIQIEHVSKSFVRRRQVGWSRHPAESREVLKDVSLSVNRGEIVTILGRNGSGKTTLARILSTLIIPATGRARVCGYDVTQESKEVRKRIGVLLNSGDTGFQPRLSAYANLEYYSGLYEIPMRLARERIRTLLADFDLADRGSDQYQSYSTGMRRRLAIAKSILPDPTVLLLDEPTLGVDPWSTEHIHNLLLELARRGKTILCMTNNLSEAKSLSSRTLVLEKGLLSSSSSIHEVLAS